MAALATELRLAESDVAVAGLGPENLDAQLVSFPYDFRQSVADCAQALDAALRMRVQGRPVVLVAHSMGGLVAARWWADLSDGIDVRQIITLGTPFQGATKALDWVVNGITVAGVPIPIGSAPEVYRGWPSMFDLLPHAQVVEGNPAGGYPHQLPETVTRAVPGFAARAEQAYRANAEMQRALAARAENGHCFTPYFSQAKKTPCRALFTDERLVTLKEDPDWVPPGWETGDGTVPMFSTIPQALEEQPRAWGPQQKLSHGDLVKSEAVVEAVGRYGLTRLPGAARGPDHHRPYLRLDLDDVLPAGQPQSVRVQVIGPEGTPLRATEVAGRLAGQRFRGEADGDAWTLPVPAVVEGIHQLRVTATGVPDCDRLTMTTTVGMTSCANA